MATPPPHPRNRCSICGGYLNADQGIPGSVIRSSVVSEILMDKPDWSPESFICHDDLNIYRGRYVRKLLDDEKGDLTSLEEKVLQSWRDHEILTTELELFEEHMPLQVRLANSLAKFGGSWGFLIGFILFIAIWIAANSLSFIWFDVDPYPFILLNLLLSCLAAIQAPIILMSQNREEVRDRLRATNDYQINLKAELEIRQLHEKIDHLLLNQWKRLAQIQEIQVELLSEFGRRGNSPRPLESYLPPDDALKD